MSNVTVHTSTTYHDANTHLNDNNKSNARANIYLNGNRNQKQARQDNSSVANKPNDHTTHALSIDQSRHNKNNGEDTLSSKLWSRNAHTMTRHSYLTDDSKRRIKFIAQESCDCTMIWRSWQRDVLQQEETRANSISAVPSIYSL